MEGWAAVEGQVDDVVEGQVDAAVEVEWAVWTPSIRERHRWIVLNREGVELMRG